MMGSGMGWGWMFGPLVMVGVVLLIVLAVRAIGGGVSPRSSAPGTPTDAPPGPGRDIPGRGDSFSGGISYQFSAGGNGGGSGRQKAGAYRMAARCSVELEDFDGAQNYLEKALAAEGKSKSNLALQSEIKKQYALHRSKMLADSGANGYIPKGKLDPIAIERAASNNSSRRSSYPSSSYSRRSTTTSYNSYQPLNYSIPSYSPPPRRVQTSLGSGSSYPTTNSRYQTNDDYLTTFHQPQIPSGLPKAHRETLERAYSRPSSLPYRPRIVDPSTGYRAPSLPSSGYSPPNPYGR